LVGTHLKLFLFYIKKENEEEDARSLRISHTTGKNYVEKPTTTNEKFEKCQSTE
jgi:hypothetical protein